MTDFNRFSENAKGNRGPWLPERQQKMPQYKHMILDGIASGLFLSEISQELDISVNTIRLWRQADKEFDENFTDAESVVTDSLEKEAIRRARNGVLEPLVAGGKVVIDPSTDEPMQIRRYSDGLMQFLLKGRRRDVYGDKREVDAKIGIDVVGAKSSLEAKFAAAAAITHDNS